MGIFIRILLALGYAVMTRNSHHSTLQKVNHWGHVLHALGHK